MAKCNRKEYPTQEINDGIVTPMGKAFISFRDTPEYLARCDKDSFDEDDTLIEVRLYAMTAGALLEGIHHFSTNPTFRKGIDAYWATMMELDLYHWVKFMYPAPWNFYYPPPSKRNQKKCMFLKPRNCYIHGPSNYGKTFMIKRAHLIAGLHRSKLLYITTGDHKKDLDGDRIPDPIDDIPDKEEDSASLFSEFYPEKHAIIAIDDVDKNTFKNSDAELLRNMISGQSFTLTRKDGTKAIYAYWNGFFTMAGKIHLNKIFNAQVLPDLKGVIQTYETNAPNLPSSTPMLRG